MTNAEKFQEIFKKFATEVWAFPEKDFLTWLNAEYKEPTIRNCLGCKYSKDNHNQGIEECHLCMWENQYTPTSNNNLGVDCIDRAELLKAMDTWDKFGYSARYGLERLDKDDKGFVPYVKYDDMVNCVKGMPSVTPQEPRWIPLTKRPMTDEEREYYREWSDVDGDMIFDCELPEDGQEVLVSHGGYVCVDTFCKDEGCYFEGVDIDEVDAWMSLPEPYREVKE